MKRGKARMPQVERDIHQRGMIGDSESELTYIIFSMGQRKALMPSFPKEVCFNS